MLRNSITASNLLRIGHSSSDEDQCSLTSDEEIPDKIFTIKNLDTGEEIDLRDENKETFQDKFVRVVSIKPELYLEQFL
jgi:hypothetical protein